MCFLFTIYTIYQRLVTIDDRDKIKLDVWLSGDDTLITPSLSLRSHTMVSPRLTLMLVLITASILSLPAEARRRAPGGRCGLSCYRSAQQIFPKVFDDQ